MEGTVDRSLERYWDYQRSANGCRAEAPEWDEHTAGVLLGFADEQERRANALLRNTQPGACKLSGGG
jgi:hypothetical protein